MVKEEVCRIKGHRGGDKEEVCAYVSVFVSMCVLLRAGTNMFIRVCLCVLCVCVQSERMLGSLRMISHIRAACFF